VEHILSRRERKKLETREALLDAALTLFREKGYDETTVEEITERADVAKGTFFNYFPTKEDLLGESAAWRVEQLRAALEVSTGAPASPVGRIKLLMRLMYEQTIEDIKLVQRAFVVRLCNPPPLPHQAKRQLFGLFTDLVHEAQACGEIRADVDAKVVSDLLHLFFFRQMRVCGHNDALVPAEHFEYVIDLLMDGLAGPKWRNQTIGG
jgi:TetR/AcrR family transcriptional regulator, cholesterol catabolism regulator